MDKLAQWRFGNGCCLSRRHCQLVFTTTPRDQYHKIIVLPATPRMAQPSDKANARSAHPSRFLSDPVRQLPSLQYTDGPKDDSADGPCESMLSPTRAPRKLVHAYLPESRSLGTRSGPVVLPEVPECLGSAPGGMRELAHVADVATRAGPPECVQLAEHALDTPCADMTEDASLRLRRQLAEVLKKRSFPPLPPLPRTRAVPGGRAFSVAGPAAGDLQGGISNVPTRGLTLANVLAGQTPGHCASTEPPTPRRPHRNAQNEPDTRWARKGRSIGEASSGAGHERGGTEQLRENPALAQHSRGWQASAGSVPGLGGTSLWVPVPVTEGPSSWEPQGGANGQSCGNIEGLQPCEDAHVGDVGLSLGMDRESAVPSVRGAEHPKHGQSPRDPSAQHAAPVAVPSTYAPGHEEHVGHCNGQGGLFHLETACEQGSSHASRGSLLPGGPDPAGTQWDHMEDQSTQPTQPSAFAGGVPEQSPREVGPATPEGYRGGSHECDVSGLDLQSLEPRLQPHSQDLPAANTKSPGLQSQNSDKQNRVLWSPGLPLQTSDLEGTPAQPLQAGSLCPQSPAHNLEAPGRSPQSLIYHTQHPELRYPEHPGHNHSAPGRYPRPPHQHPRIIDGEGYPQPHVLCNGSRGHESDNAPPQPTPLPDKLRTRLVAARVTPREHATAIAQHALARGPVEESLRSSRRDPTPAVLPDQAPWGLPEDGPARAMPHDFTAGLKIPRRSASLGVAPIHRGYVDPRKGLEDEREGCLGSAEAAGWGVLEGSADDGDARVLPAKGVSSRVSGNFNSSEPRGRDAGTGLGFFRNRTSQGKTGTDAGGGEVQPSLGRDPPGILRGSNLRERENLVPPTSQISRDTTVSADTAGQASADPAKHVVGCRDGAREPVDGERGPKRGCGDPWSARPTACAAVVEAQRGGGKLCEASGRKLELAEARLCSSLHLLRKVGAPVQRGTVQCSTVQYSAIPPYNGVPNGVFKCPHNGVHPGRAPVQRGTVQYSTVQYPLITGCTLAGPLCPP